MSGRKLHTLPLKRKIELIDAVEKCPAGKKKKEIAEEFGIVPTTLSTIVKDTPQRAFPINFRAFYLFELYVAPRNNKNGIW